MSSEARMAYTYEHLSAGYFAHDDAKDPLIAVPARFGLVDSSKERWDKLFSTINALNANTLEGTVYKLFLLSRHGQGYHNVAESKYGTKAWDDYWSKLEGDGELVWGPDPELTELGISQAQDIQGVWREEKQAGLSPPHRRYCSPFTRALDTCDVLFDGVADTHPFPVLVLELCREENGVHTCDKRRSRSYIASHKPHFTIEDGFEEEDLLWSAEVRETKDQVAKRAKLVLDKVFAETRQDETFISITAHGGWINGFLKAIGRNPFPLPTGGVLPLIVKGTTIHVG